MHGGSQKLGSLDSQRQGHQRGGKKEFSPYATQEDGEQRRKTRAQSVRPRSQLANRSVSPFITSTARTKSALKSTPTKTTAYKKSLSLLAQLSQQETDDFKAHFTRQRPSEISFDPVATTGRLRERKTHHRRSSEDVCLLLENRDLKTEVQRLEDALQSAQQTISDLRSLIKVRDSEPVRRQSLPGEVPVPMLKLPEAGVYRGFHEEFMDNLANFSQSWRDAIANQH